MEDVAEAVRGGSSAHVPLGFLHGDWRDFCQKEPNSYQEKIRIHEPLENMEIIGYLNRIDTKGFSNVGGHEDLRFKEKLTHCPFKTDTTKYVVTADTHANVNASVLKYDKIPAKKEDLDQEIFKLALEDCKKFYGPLADSCRILPLEELTYDPDTSPGVKFRIAGAKTKEQSISDYLESTGASPEAIDRFFDVIRKSWDTHHVEKVPSLWKQASKIELLKLAKVRDGDLRGFTCPELDFLFNCMRMNSDFNEKCHQISGQFSTNFQRVGYTLQKGGWTRLIERHTNPDFVKTGEGDAYKYDSNLADFLFDVVKDVRYHCWDKKGMTPEEWWQRQNWYYENKVHSYILLPSGQIVRKHTGNPSGQDSTTDDNCIIHTFVLCYAWRKLFGRSLFDDRFLVAFDIYADDHIFSLPKLFEKFADYEERRKIYAEFGIILSKDKDLVSDRVEGHTFLGPVATRVDGILCPVYNRDKIVCAVLRSEKKYPLDIQIGRVISLMLNSAFDEELFNFLRSYVYELLNSTSGNITFPTDLDTDLIDVDWLKSVPTRTDVIKFWMGYEVNRQGGCGPCRDRF